MKRHLSLIVFVFVSLTACFFFGKRLSGQGLEGVIVEKYYVDSPNSADTTYRVFIDMAEGYKLLAVYGFDDSDESTGNTLEFTTTTGFYNDLFGVSFGNNLNALLFNAFPTAALDSYISFGAAATNQFGIPKADDTDNSTLVTQLTNVPPDGISPSGTDGFTAGSTTSASTLAMTLSGVSSDGQSYVGTDDGSFFVLGGVEGIAPNNTLMIGQFTTSGEFSFAINIQIKSGSGVNELYVHTNAEQPDGSFGTVSPFLKYPVVGVPGCTNTNACNFNEDATVDDGSCLVPEQDCTECNSDNTALDLIDDDGDGVCNADEIPGCTNPLACNYNSQATDDNGSCTDEPEENCTFCVGPNLVLIDDDGDGICNAEEIEGCTNPNSCNYNENATDDDDSCTDEPEVNCTECQGQELVLIDTDGDGICDAEEISGCTNPLACNYNNEATEDDGSCTDEPEENCTECQGDDLVLIDADGDGICDDNEIAGCTNSLSCNFNENATDDDGSCTDIPAANCTECQGEVLVLIDSDGDGICDANEIAGCTNSIACNYDTDATDDDGSCIEPIENCLVCNENNDGLDLVDDDGDGVCNADDVCPELPNLVNGDPCVTEDGFDGTVAGCECVTDVVLGCISQTACNYNPDANLDDGSCIEPIENCLECNETNTGLIIIDSDGDGICDANEIAGCTNPLSCNYSNEATDDDGSCTDEPEENCTECQDQELVLIDTDGDGICDANEIEGCTNPLSCNYNDEATDDDGSCTDEPEENCTECQGQELVLIDTDGDGICDANEIAGCTDPEAENYNPNATEEDGSCLYVASISLLELECGAKIIQVTNAQATNTGGGTAIADTRTVYAYGPDNQGEIPTYSGTIWPYVIVPVGYSIDDPEITADITSNSENVLLIDGRPLYQYTGDGSAEETNGTIGPWSYFLPSGGISQDACNTEGLENSQLEAEINIFPNPARKVLNIQVNSDVLKGQEIQFSVYNSIGEQILELQDFQKDVVENYSIAVEMLSKGVYLLNIEAETGKKSLRFIKN